MYIYQTICTMGGNRGGFLGVAYEVVDDKGGFWWSKRLGGKRGGFSR